MAEFWTYTGLSHFKFYFCVFYKLFPAIIAGLMMLLVKLYPIKK